MQLGLNNLVPITEENRIKGIVSKYNKASQIPPCESLLLWAGSKDIFIFKLKLSFQGHGVTVGFEKHALHGGFSISVLVHKENTSEHSLPLSFLAPHGTESKEDSKIVLRVKKENIFGKKIKALFNRLKNNVKIFLFLSFSHIFPFTKHAGARLVTLD